MKTTHGLLIFLFALGVAVASAADPALAAPSGHAPGSGMEMATLERFLDLSDDELEQMQRAIALIRAMNPEQRAALRREVDKFRQLPDGERQQLRRGWGALEAGQQEAWRRMMHAASAERRAQIQAELQALPPDKKSDYRRRLTEEFLRQEGKK